MTPRKVSSPEKLYPVIDDLCRDSCKILEVFGDTQSSVIRYCAKTLHRPYEHIGLVGIVKYNLPHELRNEDYSALCPYLQQYGSVLVCTNDEVVREALNPQTITEEG